MDLHRAQRLSELLHPGVDHRVGSGQGRREAGRELPGLAPRGERMVDARAGRGPRGWWPIQDLVLKQGEAEHLDAQGHAADDLGFAALVHDRLVGRVVPLH